MVKRTRVLALATALTVTLIACAPDNTTVDPAPTTIPTTTTTSSVPPASTSTTTTVAPTTTTSTSTTTTTLATGSTITSADGSVLITQDVPFTSRLQLDVFAPASPGTFPVVVLFHGGGWVGGHPDDIAPLATSLAASGTIVFNAPYRLALRGGGYPLTFEDAACAVRFARQQAPQFGGDPGTVTVVGYSAGAHIGAVTALAGNSFNGDCLVDSGSALPDAFVGIAGPYDSDLLDPLLLVFFGTDRAEDPAPWEDGNPYTHIGSNPDLKVRLIQGQLDLLVPAGFAVVFNDALRAAGYDVGLTLVEDGDHGSVVDPEEDGDLVIAAVQEVTGQSPVE